MSDPIKSPITEAGVARYILELTPESPVGQRLRLETLRLPRSGMISSRDVGALLDILVRMVGGRKAIEVGTFTGYTALRIASALPADGRLVCCDISDEWTRIGRPFWKEAGVDARIDLRLAPALETLNALIADGGAGGYDFVFIDADKTSYDSYYEACLRLIRPGGLIVLDNMLWSGRVADPSQNDESTVALRALNEKIARDSRVRSCLMSVGDGLMLAFKNP